MPYRDDMKKDNSKKHKSKENLNHCFTWAVPKLYRKYLWKTHRVKERIALCLIKKNEDEEVCNFPFQHRHSALWNYW